jgi:hypothetical protein
MRKENQKAWEILTSDEQLALTLKLGHNKSSWEVGEIVGRAHYKYLEIEARARQFLKIFTEHFLYYDEVMPSYLGLDPRVKKYFELLIQRRRTVKEAVDLICDNYFDVTSFREKLILEDMKKLLEGDTVKKNVYLLIVEFDRWNNFRILPKSIQEPSAFKRRNKTLELRNIKTLINLHTYLVENLVKKYHKRKSNLEARIVYVPIYSKFLDKKDKIIELELTEENQKYFSSLGLYIFTKKPLALEFLELLLEYVSYTKKSCKLGQKFWPKFREMTQQSINYNEVQKKIPSRKFLESAVKEIEVFRAPKKKVKNFKEFLRAKE